MTDNTRNGREAEPTLSDTQTQSPCPVQNRTITLTQRLFTTGLTATGSFWRQSRVAIRHRRCCPNATRAWVVELVSRRGPRIG
jgi:hypothetical protein